MKTQPEVSGEKEELRIKVAELCGWHGIYQWGNNAWFGTRLNCDTNRDTPIPDYPNDLNACAGFENDVLKLNVRLYLQYARQLIHDCQGEIDALFATAEQRCRAFIATMEGTK